MRHSNSPLKLDHHQTKKQSQQLKVQNRKKRGKEGRRRRGKERKEEGEGREEKDIHLQKESNLNSESVQVGLSKEYKKIHTPVEDWIPFGPDTQ